VNIDKLLGDASVRKTRPMARTIMEKMMVSW
jgi:hypothetical protein